MKKVLKVFMAAALLVTLMPSVAYANNVVDGDGDVVEVDQGFVPFSPDLPQDWTMEQWEEWSLALEMCLFVALDEAQRLVDEATAILVAAGVPVAVVPSSLLVASAGNFVIPPARNVDITQGQIDVLSSLVNRYTDLSTRITNFLTEFETVAIPFEVAIVAVTEFCVEAEVLNAELVAALASINGDDPVTPTPDPDRPGGGPGAPQQPGPGTPAQPGRPTLPQTGTTVALAGVGAAGIALTAIGAITALKKRKSNS